MTAVPTDRRHQRREPEGGATTIHLAGLLQLGDAIDTAFARWDRAHLCLFELADATDVCGPIA
jgi:hypothetical protein